MKNKSIYAYAFEKTFPVLVGYVFLGAAYGILMETNGYGLLWGLAMSICVYAGSLQYASIPMLVAQVNPIYAFLMALMINARHLFYGISMLGKYNNLKKNKFYLIFGLTDETFSIVCDEKIPENYSKEEAYFFITLFDQLYWIAGTALGCVAGQFLTFNTAGLDFALTALFVVIFVSQWLDQSNHFPAITGVVASTICLVVFGADSFIIPAMILIMVILTANYFKGGKNDVK